MKKIFFLGVLLLGIGSVCIAQQYQVKDRNNFILQGEINGKEGDTVKVDFFPSSTDFKSPESDYAVIKNGQFKLSLADLKHPGYINIMLNDSAVTFRLFPNIPLLLLIEPGDHIRLHFKDGKPLFSGTGAAKYNCRVAMDIKQHEIYSHNGPKINDYLQSIEYNKRRYDTVMHDCLKILNGYKNSLSRESYEILKLDRESLPRFILSTTLFGCCTFLEVKKYLEENSSYFEPIRSTSVRPDRSRVYTDFLLKKERLLSAIDIHLKDRSGAVVNRNMLHSIESKYTGPVKDKLLATVLASTLFELGDSTEILKQQALSNMTTPEYREIIEKNNNLFAKGSGVYDFQLQDSSGHVINLSDYRGKVVVLDFYFLGCHGCAYLSKALTPVIDHFKENPDVVFITINTDKSRDRFIKALNSGKYTHPETVNLYTNGLGQEYEMIKKYGFQGYPQFLLVDKHGKILHEKPSRPELDHKTGEPNAQDPNVLKLIEIIKNGLELNQSKILKTSIFRL